MFAAVCEHFLKVYSLLWSDAHRLCRNCWRAYGARHPLRSWAPGTCRTRVASKKVSASGASPQEGWHYDHYVYGLRMFTDTYGPFLDVDEGSSVILDSPSGCKRSAFEALLSAHLAGRVGAQAALASRARSGFLSSLKARQQQEQQHS